MIIVHSLYKVIDLRSSDLPLQVLDAHLLPRLLIIVKPFPLLQTVDTLEFSGGIDSVRKPFPLKIETVNYISVPSFHRNISLLIISATIIRA